MISPMRLGSKSFQLLDVLLHGHKNFTKEVKGIGERDISLQFSKGCCLFVMHSNQSRLLYETVYKIRSII